MNRKRIGQKIVALRTKKKMRQQDVASELGVSRDHISEIERGETSPTVEEFINLLKLLDSSPKEFFETKVPNIYEDPDDQELHEKLQDILDSNTPYASGIEVNVIGLHDAMSRFVENKQKTLRPGLDEKDQRKAAG
jgi:transcriptional regulator with XRE-family HTH domain